MLLWPLEDFLLTTTIQHSDKFRHFRQNIFRLAIHSSGVTIYIFMTLTLRLYYTVFERDISFVTSSLYFIIFFVKVLNY